MIRREFRIFVELHRRNILDLSGKYLVTSANESLVGAKLPYLEKGAPAPVVSPSANSDTNQWGGLEAGKNMVYPIQCVDGVVAIAGGKELREACRRIEKDSHNFRCPVGQNVETVATGDLRKNFELVLHSVVPYYFDPEWSRLMLESYNNILDRVMCSSGEKEVVLPLLGAGQKGAPPQEAAKIAVKSLSIYNNCNQDVTLRFAFVDDDSFKEMDVAMKREFSRPFKKTPTVVYFQI
eukprot:g2654.t1